MSKSFREGFVCWLHGFYSAGKYIHLIALWMVRIWINETDCSMNRGINEDQFPVGLWPMFLPFLPFCCPLFSMLPITSPCCIPLSSSHQFFISSSPCCPVWASTDIQLHRAAQGCSLTPSWPSLSGHLLLPPPLPRPRSLEEASDVWRPVKSESKWSIKWPTKRSTELTGKRDVMMYPSVS